MIALFLKDINSFIFFLQMYFLTILHVYSITPFHKIEHYISVDIVVTGRIKSVFLLLSNGKFLINNLTELL